MERTVEERYLQLIQRIACEDTVGHSLLEALLYRGDEFLRHVTALDFVYELQIAFEAFVGGLYTDDDVSELTATTRLLLVDFTELNGLRDSFLIRYLGLTLVSFDLEFALQTVDNDLQVELTHTADDGLTGLFVGLHTEGGVFFGELSQTDTHLIHILLRLRLDSDTDNGLGEVDRLEDDRSIFGAERITRTDILEAYTSTDVTAADDFHGVLLVGVHLEEA